MIERYGIWRPRTGARGGGARGAVYALLVGGLSLAGWWASGLIRWMFDLTKEAMAMRFSEQLRREAHPLWQASFDHPFVRGIGDGGLPLDCFRYYVLQDSYYLSCFARVQALGAVKSPDLKTANLFALHVQATYQAEAALHERFLTALGVTEEERRTTPPSPTAYAYTSHLLRVGYEGTLGEIVAALLPCYWLYREIGQRLQGAEPPVELYRQWIAAYHSEWFDQAVREMIDRLDELADQAGDAERERMRAHFLVSDRYELMFLEMTCRREAWPAGG